MTRTIVIGDIHGCIEELKLLLDKIQPRPQDIIVPIGDVIHKGPFPNKTLRWTMKGTRIVPIMGNHEEKEIRGFDWYYSDTQRRYIEGWPLFWKPNKHFIVVHAGIPYNLKTLPHTSNLKGIKTLPRKEKEIALNMLRVRYETPEGGKVTLGNEQPGDIFWAQRYDGRFGTCFFGHQVFPTEQFPRRFKHAIPLDYGCVYGGYLAAAIIDNETGKYTIEKVKALKKYRNRSIINNIPKE